MLQDGRRRVLRKEIAAYLEGLGLVVVLFGQRRQGSYSAPKKSSAGSPVLMDRG